MIYGYTIITDWEKREEAESELRFYGAQLTRADIYTKRNALPYREKIVDRLRKGDIFLGMSVQNVASGIGDFIDLVEAIDKHGATLKIARKVAPFLSDSTNAPFYLSALVTFTRDNIERRGKAISNAKNSKKQEEL